MPSRSNLTSEIIPTRLEEGGRPVALELVARRPSGPGPFPTLVFNHGSTGSGTNPAVFRRTMACAPLADFFAERGWQVIFPQRRGRGKSGGLYDEGFKLDRSGYSWDPQLSLPGVDRAIEDLDAVMEHICARPDVKQEHLVIGGTSRGGILAIAYAGERPSIFKAAINFNGGWLGRACPTHLEVNRKTFLRGSAFPRETLWLHGSHDQYYRIAHCRENFDAFRAAGGRGAFHALRGGHALIYRPQLWAATMTDYLDAIA